jgi:hypothetical protein
MDVHICSSGLQFGSHEKPGPSCGLSPPGCPPSPWRATKSLANTGHGKQISLSDSCFRSLLDAFKARQNETENRSALSICFGPNRAVNRAEISPLPSGRYPQRRQKVPARYGISVSLAFDVPKIAADGTRNQKGFRRSQGGIEQTSGQAPGMTGTFEPRSRTNSAHRRNC